MTTLTSSQLGDMLGDLGIENTQTVTLNGAPTGGTFTLTYQAQTTTAIAWNATPDAVQTALAALSTIGAGNVSVSGDPGGPYTLTLYSGLAQVAMTAVSSLTGGTTPSISIVQIIVFSDTALQRLYDRATTDAGTGGAYIYERAIAYGYRQLWMAAGKLHDMSVGQVRESLGQVATHLEAQYRTWAEFANISGGNIFIGTLSLAIDEPYSTSMQTIMDNYLAIYRSA